MEDQWSTRWSTPRQQDYVQFIPYDPIRPDQWQNLNANSLIQNCFCPICSNTRDTVHDMTGGIPTYQAPSPPVGFIDTYANQNVGIAHPNDIPTTVGHPVQAWSVVPQAPQYQENPRYAPLHEVVDRSQVQMDMAPNEGALDLSYPERLRRLAGHYVSNPDSTVNGVHLEPGPSGRFQVVITIDIGDILGDANN